MLPTKHLLVTLLLSFSFIANAQEKKSVSQVGLNYSVDYSYRTLDADASVQWIADMRDENEVAVFGFNTGATYSYQFKKGLILEGSFQYTRVGDQYNEIELMYSDGTTGKGTFINNYDYLGIPVKIGYGLPVGKRLRLSIMSGIATNFFLARHYRVTINNDNGTSEKHSSTYKKEPFGSQFEDVNFASVSSLGIDIRVFRNFSVRFEPTFRYSINPIMDAPIKQRPYSAGLNTTVFYTFGKNKKADSKEDVTH